MRGRRQKEYETKRLKSRALEMACQPAFKAADRAFRQHKENL